MKFYPFFFSLRNSRVTFDKFTLLIFLKFNYSNVEEYVDKKINLLKQYLSIYLSYFI